MTLAAAWAGLTGSILLGAEPVEPSTGRGAEWGKAAPIGLLILLLLGLAVFFLIKSMNRNLRKVPASFDDPPEAAGGTAEPPTAPTQAEPGADPGGRKAIADVSDPEPSPSTDHGGSGPRGSA